MESPVLFGYTIEEKDDTLVITVSGTLAKAALASLRERSESGEQISIQSFLSPLVPIGRLLSRRVTIREEQRVAGAVPGAAVQEQPMAQELDQSFAAFEQQIAEFRKVVDELKAGRKS